MNNHRIGSDTDEGITLSSKEHEINQHQSEYDKKQPHFHFVYAKEINIDMLKKLFAEIDQKAIKDPAINTIISPQSRAGILNVASQYFKELETHPMAQKAEEDYKKDKVKAYEKAQAKEKTDNSGRNQISAMLISTLFNMSLEKLQNRSLSFQRRTRQASADAMEKSLHHIIQANSKQAAKTHVEKKSTEPEEKNSGFYGLFAESIRKQAALKTKTSATKKAQQPNQTSGIYSDTDKLKHQVVAQASTPQSENLKEVQLENTKQCCVM